jgi:hypothetical protein
VDHACSPTTILTDGRRFLRARAGSRIRRDDELHTFCPECQARVRHFLMSVPIIPADANTSCRPRIYPSNGGCPQVAARWACRNVRACDATWRVRNGKLRNPVVGPVDDGLPVFCPECAEPAPAKRPTRRSLGIAWNPDTPGKRIAPRSARASPHAQGGAKKYDHLQSGKPLLEFAGTRDTPRPPATPSPAETRASTGPWPSPSNAILEERRTRALAC